MNLSKTVKTIEKTTNKNKTKLRKQNYLKLKTIEVISSDFL